MPEPLDIIRDLPEGELQALIMQGGTPELPPALLQQELAKKQGAQSQRREPRTLDELLPPLNAPLSALVESLYGPLTERPEAPPSRQAQVEAAQAPWFEPASQDAILAGVNRMMAQGTPGSAMPEDMAQTGPTPAPMLPQAPPGKPPGMMGLSMPAIQQQMLMEAARRPQSPAVAAAGGAGGQQAPAGGGVAAPILQGAQAAQQAAAAASAAQAQTAPPDPYAGMPPALAAALKEYTTISADLKKQDDTAKWLALAKAGFAMAGSNKGFFGALGDAGLSGLDAYQAAMSQDAANRMKAAGMDLDVAKMTQDWESGQAAAARQREQDIIDAEYKRARIGALNRSNRGGGGQTQQQGITQAQYLSMIQRAANDLANSVHGTKYITDPAALQADAVAQVDSYLQRTGITVRGQGGAAPQPQTLGAVAAGPQPGTVQDGYMFLGGDPADQNNWEPVDE